MSSFKKPNNSFWDAVETLLNRIASESLRGVKHPVEAIIAGGVAVHYYTEYRLSSDIDIQFSHRFHLPNDKSKLFVYNGEESEIIIDSNYGSHLGMMHPDYQKDAIFVDVFGGVLNVSVLSPLDLVVSKVARFQENDKHDILMLARLGLINDNDFLARAHEALDYFIGDTALLKYNIEDTLKLIESCQTPSPH